MREWVDLYDVVGLVVAVVAIMGHETYTKWQEHVLDR